MTEKTNVLLITVDDLNYDSVGCFGCMVDNITPNIDRLACEGLRFENSHVTIGICQPSRSVLLTGRYPHHNGARGFEEIDGSVTTLTQRLHEHGYINGIIGKEDHIAPKEKFFWDEYVQTYCKEEGWGRDAEVYYDKVTSFLERAKAEDKPFFLMANSHDPHRPYAGADDEMFYFGHHTKAERVYTPEEITVPGCLPDLPDVRKELSQYFTSVHRGDKIVGRVLDALDDAGLRDSTFVLFLSDNGMALPYAKTNCYLNSTRSPFIMRWPSHIKAGTVSKALISSVDYTDTVLDILGIEPIIDTDGSSLKDTMLNGAEHSDEIYTFIFKTNNNHITHRPLHYPMRCVQNKRYAYIFNAWSDGEKTFLNESTEGLTFKAMERAGQTDEAIRKRVEFFKYRVVEELYDYEKDPHALNNLASLPEFSELLDRMRLNMYDFMKSSQDGLVDDFYHKIIQKSHQIEKRKSMNMSKAMFIGLDGAIPKLIKKFSEEGAIPNITALMQKGCFSEMLSQIPVATPINWASLSTGAVPGVHNVVGFWCHKKGDRLDKYTSENAFTNSFIAAERIWEAVERQGGRSVLMKFPGSWPSSVKNGAQVDGYCIPSYNGSILDLSCNGCFSVQELYKSKKITLLPANDWKNVEQYAVKQCAEIKVALKKNYAPLTYQMLAVGDECLERVLLCTERDAATAVAELKAGEWSGWIKETLASDMLTAIRFKLISLSGDGSDIRLYHSQLYPSRGFTKPDALGAELQERFGPMIEFASPHAWKYGWVDLDTCYEEAEYQASWMADASQYLLSEPWDLFVTQFHWIDHVQHYFLPWADPVSPSYKPEKEEYAWSVLRKAYHLADSYVGRLLKNSDDNTSVFVLSDHGNICDEYTVSLLPLFVKEGLIVLKTDAEGQRQVDWSHTVAYPCKPGNCDIFINLQGRDPEGCVAPEDYEPVRLKVIGILRDLAAPDGRKVFDMVLRCEDAVPLGLFGEYSGDIIAVYAQGISWAGHGGEEWDREDEIFAVSSDESMDYGAHHGPMSPTAETAVCSNKAFVVAQGRNIRSGYDRSQTRLGPVRVIDVAPTICSVMGISPPSESQGAVIGDFSKRA